MIDLWLTAAEDRPEGVLTGWDDTDIALAAGWEGDPLELVKSLIDCGWLDVLEDGTYKLHDWEEHQGWACGAKARSEKAAKARWEKRLCSSNAQAMQEDQSSNAPSPSPSPSPDKSIKQNCPHQKIIELYHKNLPMLPIVQNHSKELKDRLRARWREDPERQNLDWWEWYFENVSKCDFLVGKIKDWAASFYWLTGPKNMTKVLNGEYLSRGKLSKTDQAIEDFLDER